MVYTQFRLAQLLNSSDLTGNYESNHFTWRKTEAPNGSNFFEMSFRIPMIAPLTGYADFCISTQIL